MTILIDVSPAAGGHGERGIGRYVRGLLAGMALWPVERRRLVWGVGLAGYRPAELDDRFVASGSLAWKPAAAGWLTGRLAYGRAAKRCGAGAIHATDPFHPWLPGGPRRIVTAYDLIPLREPSMTASWRPYHRWSYGRYLDQLKTADLVVAISHATATDLTERLGIAAERISVVYPAVVGPARVERREPDEPTFLFVSALDVHKQPELAIDALAAFRRRQRGGRLVFIGPDAPPTRAALLAKAAALGLTESVEFRGRIPDEELDRAYAGATALLSTSRVEGFGLPPVEAICRGVPVVAVDSPAAREVVGDAASLVPPDAEAIAAAMAAPKAPTPESAAALATRFSPAATGAALLAVYEGVAG